MMTVFLFVLVAVLTALSGEVIRRLVKHYLG